MGETDGKLVGKGHNRHQVAECFSFPAVKPFIVHFNNTLKVTDPDDKFILAQGIKPTLIIKTSIRHVTTPVLGEKGRGSINNSLNFYVLAAKVSGV